MREIKCEAWDSINKKMLSWNDIGWMETNGKFSTHTLLSGQYANFTPRLFTGLKDKNGKEIYEGDLLSHELGLLAEVLFHKSWGAFCARNIRATQSVPFYNDSQMYEVIGNIYEHPQLLE